MVKEPAILHTTIARLLQPPGSSSDHENGRKGASSGGEDGSGRGGTANSRGVEEGGRSDVGGIGDRDTRTVLGEGRDLQADAIGLSFRPPDGYFRAGNGDLNTGVDVRREINATAAADAVAAASMALCGSKLRFK
eukprot:1156316-Pelagomonas_calceolata.AAC.1